MMDGSADAVSLWEALGGPCIEHTLPLARTDVWRRASLALANRLSALGVPWRPRSPRALWMLARREPPHPGATWGTCARGTPWALL